MPGPTREKEFDTMSAVSFRKLAFVTAALGMAASMTSCESLDQSGVDRALRGIHGVGGGHGQPVIGESCAGGGDRICIGVSYVTYVVNGSPVVGADQVAANMERINRIWAQCGIAFQVERYEAVRPEEAGLPSGSAAGSQTEAVRRGLADDSTFLIAQTGYWGTTKNAWTQSPGFSTHGAVLESTVATSAEVIAHELGHYVNLDHVSDSSNLLSPLIYPDSDTLYSSQCATARESAQRDWPAMLR
jgi:hypothetical protein